MRQSCEQPLLAVDGTTSPVSAAIDAGYVLYASLQSVATGTLVGTLKLQVSNDPKSPSNWVDLPSSSLSVSSAGTLTTAKLDIAHRWLRVAFVFTSGAGNITAQLKTTGA